MDDAEFAILKERAHYDNADAQYELAKMYLRGENVPVSRDIAYTWFRKAAVLGHRESQYKMGVEALGTGSYREAAEWMRKAAEQGHVRAMHSLGCLHRDGKGVEQSYEIAARWFLEAAGHEDADSEFETGRLYMDGKGFPESHEEAAEWFSKSADHGSKEAVRGLWRLANKGNARALKELERLANGGDTEAQLLLGRMHLDGKYAEKSNEKAAELFAEAASQGHVDAAYLLGRLYKDGRGVEQSFEKAASLFRDATDKGNANAMYELGCLYKKGAGVEQSCENAIEWLGRAAKKNHPGSVTALRDMAERGDCWTLYRIGLVFRDEDVKSVTLDEAADLLLVAHLKGCPDALRSLHETARMGSSQARYDMWIACRDGKCDVFSVNDAVKFCRMAALNGHPSAQRDMSMMYEHGVGVSRSDQSARKWYIESIEEDVGKAGTENTGRDSDAFNGMRGGCNTTDKGELPDKEAFELCSKAARLGNPEAQLSLGRMYLDGRGVNKSSELASVWIEVAARQGLETAQLFIGEMYERGNGVDASYRSAAEWYKKAAEQGNTEAQYRLSLMYMKGLGVKKSPEEATRWLEQSANNGNEAARRRLESMPQMNLTSVPDANDEA